MRDIELPREKCWNFTILCLDNSHIYCVINKSFCKSKHLCVCRVVFVTKSILIFSHPTTGSKTQMRGLCKLRHSYHISYHKLVPQPAGKHGARMLSSPKSCLRRGQSPLWKTSLSMILLCSTDFWAIVF